MTPRPAAERGTRGRGLILASASPARLALLRAAGFAPEVRVSGVDEGAATARLGEPAPDVLAWALAQAKTDAVAAAIADDPDLRGALVLGCDSVLEIDGVAYGKPRDEADATVRWRLMAGREGVLHTGHALTDTASGRRTSAVASTLVRFATPTTEEIAAYVTTGEPLAVAGAFTLDGLGAPFVEGVDGCPGNVVGVSPPLLRRLLAEVGVPLTDVWPRPWAPPTGRPPTEPHRSLPTSD